MSKKQCEKSRMNRARSFQTMSYNKVYCKTFLLSKQVFQADVPLLWHKYEDLKMNVHAAELQAVSVSLVMRHQVVVVEKSDPEHCGVDADTQEEDADKAHHLVERNKTEGGGRSARSVQRWKD